MVNLTLAHIILAGGRSRRLGRVDKAQLDFRGRTLLGHALAAGRGACHQVVVGPAELPVPPGVRLVREDPPFGGPVAGIGAGVAELDRVGCSTPWLLITACDHPYAEAAAAALLEHPRVDGVDLITPTDSTGHRQTLFALYRRSALVDALDACGGGRDLSVRRLVADLRTTGVRLPDDLLDDVDDPAAAERLGIPVPQSPEP